jgi:hypothetical protein
MGATMLCFPFLGLSKQPLDWSRQD